MSEPSVLLHAVDEQERSTGGHPLTVLLVRDFGCKFQQSVLVSELKCFGATCDGCEDAAVSRTIDVAIDVHTVAVHTEATWGCPPDLCSRALVMVSVHWRAVRCDDILNR